jgi:hypothetical protein
MFLVSEVIFMDICTYIIPRLENQDLPYNGFAHRDNRNTGLGLSDKCQLFRAQASLVYIGAQQQSKAIAVELVGNRFLRRMVRILVVSTLLPGLNSHISYKLMITFEGNCDTGISFA